MQNYKTTKALVFPVVLCADFDQTCTSKDTLYLLFEAAIAQETNTKKQHKRQKDIQKVIQRYMEDTNTFVSQFFSESKAHRNNQTALLEFMKGFTKVDSQSIERVMQIQALKGIPEDELDNIAEKIQLLPNCLKTMHSAQWGVVISANWNHRMLERLLSKRCIQEEDGETSAGQVEIIANGKQSVLILQYTCMLNCQREGVLWIKLTLVIYSRASA
jgi:hypothetical protein